MGRSLAVHYLLEDTALFGGVKVALAQAELLVRRGHRVTVISRSGPPDWYPLSADFATRGDLDASDLPVPDVTVATFWTTLAAAAATAAAGHGTALHLCQGFEALGLHNRDQHEAIRRAYRLPLPAIVVSPQLRDLLRDEFERPAMLVPQPLEPAWRPAGRERPGDPPRLLVVGPYEIYLKGVPAALDAVRGLRDRGVDCRLVRLSQWPLCDDERRHLEPDEFHHAVSPDEVPALMRRCDLLLAPSWPAEGFGLPALEAMASGVPVVASDVPCYRAWAASAARLVPAAAPTAAAPTAFAVAAAPAAAEILSRPERWLAMRRAGLELAAGHTEETAGPALEAAFEWAMSGAGRRDGKESGAPERGAAGRETGGRETAGRETDERLAAARATAASGCGSA